MQITSCFCTLHIRNCTLSELLHKVCRGESYASGLCRMSTVYQLLTMKQRYNIHTAQCSVVNNGLAFAINVLQDPGGI